MKVNEKVIEVKKDIAVIRDELKFMKTELKSFSYNGQTLVRIFAVNYQ